MQLYKRYVSADMHTCIYMEGHIPGCGTYLRSHEIRPGASPEKEDGMSPSTEIRKGEKRPQHGSRSSLAFDALVATRRVSSMATARLGQPAHVLQTLRVQVPNYHILSKIVTYIITILNQST